MSPKEALSLYNFKQEEPLDEQLEFVFFELKQKIYRQLDQVLLYPKWVKELTRLSTASLALAHPFPIDLMPSNFEKNAQKKHKCTFFGGAIQLATTIQESGCFVDLQRAFPQPLNRSIELLASTTRRILRVLVCRQLTHSGYLVIKAV